MNFFTTSATLHQAATAQQAIHRAARGAAVATPTRGGKAHSNKPSVSSRSSRKQTVASAESHEFVKFEE